ncbi:FAD-dependent monooxygenase [Paenarthrobacter sp. DKR-5]|uniref:FAD-dependent monooxygenase n=1 Tax=Paenarthrobacter sp. DKR-5 TaxID=2835535 RepID=UPI001BDC3696|nr:FAD-dependent monooxygenase [Paenarthrobacter sp. DKR-5]MBT1001254.1 FAD-dependent monooxygenase [Paenarthrobacter sp. DKR-5]
MTALPSTELPTTADVLVVGAGPTGLMLAVWLRRLRIDVVLVDGKSGPTRESRALALQARTMEIYEQLGLVSAVLAQVQPAAALRPGFERRALGVLPIGSLGTGLTPFPRLYMMEQSKTERLLGEELVRLGGTVHWDTRLEALTQHAAVDGTRQVTAEVGGPAGSTTITARYCVGADGGSSTVRRLCGIPFEGITNAQTFYVADAVGVQGLDHGSINLRFGSRNLLLSFPMVGEDHHRLLGTVPDDSTLDLSEDAARRILKETFGVTYAERTWFSTYRIHHRVASAFRQGNVFLAGDAGHVHSPVGAQGMNTGLQDAHNLAFKLSDVLRGKAPDTYLDRYEAERRPVALRLVGTTDKLFHAVTSPGRAARALRRIAPGLIFPVATRVVPRLPGASRFFQYVSQIRIHYWMSDEEKAASGGKRDRVVGRRLPWTGPNFAPLQDLCWQVHAYGAADRERLTELGRRLGVPVHAFPAAADAGLEETKYYLVRPDGFVAAAAARGEAESVLAKALPWTVMG